MLITLTLVVLSLLQKTVAKHSVTIDGVKQAFLQDRIVPDVLSSFNPTTLLDVVYNPTTMQKVDVIPGITLTRSQTTNNPQFALESYPASLLNETFVVAMVDPDAPFPNNTNLSQVRHLLGGNFKLNATVFSKRTPLVNSSALISEYISPSPPLGSPPHRYVILVYTQPRNFTAAAAALVDSTTPILNFNVSTFAGTVGLGSPIAGTYFKTGPDDDSLPISGAGSNPSAMIINAATHVSMAPPVVVFGCTIAGILAYLG